MEIRAAEISDILKKQIADLGKAMDDSINTIMEVYTMPEDAKGIDSVTPTLNRTLYRASSFLYDAPGEPGQNAQHALALGHPALLHPPQGSSRGGVARQDHKIAALVEQRLNPGGRQVEDVISLPHAIGRVGVVAQIDDRQIRQPLGDGVQHGQPAKP